VKKLSPLKRSAQFHAGLGRFIFPIKPGAKNPPLIKWGTKATNNVETVGRWWDRVPTANVGLACGKSKIAVIDIDTKHGRRGQITLDHLELIDGLVLPPTLMQRTPSGGLHYFYRGEIPTSQNIIGKSHWSDGISHVDTRGVGSGAGGYVLIPPSVIKGVGAYEWINPKIPMARLPQWVIDIFTEHSALIGHNMMAQEPVVDLDQAVNMAWFHRHLEEDAPAAIEGEGGEFCTLLLAGLAKDHGISQDTALDMMFVSSWNQKRCQPAWDFDELKVKAANAYSYLAQNAPGWSTAEADFKDDPPEPIAPHRRDKFQTRIRARGKQYAAEKAAARKALR
jgi:hypothetical protein